MHMALETRPWTRADLDRLPDDGNRYEVVDGRLFVTPAPSAVHQQIVAWLSARITPFVVANGVGVVHQSPSVMVKDDSQVEPDLMVLPNGVFIDWSRAPTPILVVEVLSRSTRRRDLNEKRDFYIGRAVEEYWVVDREDRSVVRFRGGTAETVTGLLKWTPGCAETLEMDLTELFAQF